MLVKLELWLLDKVLDAATSPEARKLYVDELKKLDAAVTNPLLKAALEAIEAKIA